MTYAFIAVLILFFVVAWTNHILSVSLRKSNEDCKTLITSLNNILEVSTATMDALEFMEEEDRLKFFQLYDPIFKTRKELANIKVRSQ